MTKRRICTHEAFNSSALRDVYVTGWTDTYRADSLMECLHPELYDSEAETPCNHAPEKPIFQSPVTAFHYARTSKSPLRAFFFELPAPRVSDEASSLGPSSNKPPSHSPVAQYIGIDANAALRDYLAYNKEDLAGKHYYSCNVAFAIATIEEYLNRTDIDGETPAIFIISHKSRSPGVAQMVADLTGVETYALPESIIEQYKGQPLDTLGTLEKLKSIASLTTPQIDKETALSRYGLSERARQNVTQGRDGLVFKENDWAGVEYV